MLVSGCRGAKREPPRYVDIMNGPRKPAPLAPNVPHVEAAVLDIVELQKAAPGVEKESPDIKGSQLNSRKGSNRDEKR